MKVDIKEGDGWKRELHIELADEEVRQEMSRIVREFRRKASLPGFRKGKVPESVIESRFGDYLEEELVNQIIPKTYRAALEESGLDPIAPGSIRDFRYKKGEPLSFVADLEIRPTIEIASTDGIKLQKRVYDVSDEQITSTLEALREQSASYEPVQRPASNGDRITVELADVSTNPDAKAEQTEVILGSEGLLPEFQQALEGAEAGTFKDVTVTYPADMSNEALRGKTKAFRMRVAEIAEKILPQIDDNFAEGLGFENLEDLESRIQLRLEGEELLRAEREVEDRLIHALIERNPFEAPESMVDNLLNNLAQDLEVPDDRMEEFRRHQREGAVRAVKRMLILEAAAKSNDVRVTTDEVEAAIREGVEGEREQAKAIKAAKEDGSFERHRNRMLERKIFDHLVEAAEIEEVKASRLPESQPAGPGSR